MKLNQFKKELMSTLFTLFQSSGGGVLPNSLYKDSIILTTNQKESHRPIFLMNVDIKYQQNISKSNPKAYKKN
jgi:hypothetical protein